MSQIVVYRPTVYRTGVTSVYNSFGPHGYLAKIHHVLSFSFSCLIFTHSKQFSSNSTDVFICPIWQVRIKGWRINSIVSFLRKYFRNVHSKGQLISKANFKVFVWTKKRTIFFCISALASKMGQIIKIMAHYHGN